MRRNLTIYRSFILFFLLSLTAVSCVFSVNSKTPYQSSSSRNTTETISGIQLPKIAPEFRNPWTSKLEGEFKQRATTIIEHYANPENYGNGYGENEKSSYPRAMFDFLAGNRAKALDFLQAEDPQAKNHQHTEGIDYYYSFTLKGQIRKYFLFSQFLDPAYKKKMFLGAKKWTQIDPLSRPHPLYQYGDGSGKDWDISRRGRWVDGRNTDNLRAMRETSIYLMAEETGNEKTRLIYKQKIQRYVWALYNIGMGEWDSEVYHGHTFAPYLNLYDFAKDREVKQLAKAALDWLSAAAAIKYYRGGWGGPVKRDYGGGNVALSSSAARTFWLYFNDTPLANSNPELDTLYLITSTYRPPLAVVALAHKQFKKPVEILSTKPLYENWKSGNDRQPGYWETQFFGQSYQLGSLAGTFADGDVAPFKLMAYNSQRGVDYFVVNTNKEWVHPGKNPGDEIGQYENLLIWLRPASNVPFFFQLPKTAIIEIENNIWFFKLEKTWLAIFPINLSDYTSVTIENQKFAPIYNQEQTLKAMTQGNNYSGFALEVGELDSYGSYEQFKQKIKRQNKLDLSSIKTGIAKLENSQRKTLQLTYNSDNLLPLLVRNGKEHYWDKNFSLYHSLSSDNAPINLGWKQGKLTIKAGEFEFTNQVTNEKKVNPLS